MSTTFCGSAAYAAPELLQGVPYQGIIADVWSIGVILYIMACASMPFRDTNIKTLVKDQKAPLHVPSHLVGSFDPQLRDILERIMSFDLAKRYHIDDIKKHAWYNRVQGSAAVLSRGNSES